MRGILLLPISQIADLLTCPTVKTDNAESPRMAYNNPIRGKTYIYKVPIRQSTAGYNIPTVSIYRCLVFLTVCIM